ncbi:hypothetical protein [Bacillus sp. 03113]|uniref:hypothetical protein n=1 Tax=Bacillus sp. 03113 TaxID=2578211 RepID=UPI0011420704|nr:hypothetical protein [Bacillus sp. 03113]
MKKIIILSIISVFFLLMSGCSDQPSIAAKAEKLGKSIDHFIEYIDTLKVQDAISPKEQEKMVTEIDRVHRSIETFNEAKVPGIMKKAKKHIRKKLIEKDKILLEVKEKAEKGEATIEDVKELKKELSDDINIKLFNN